MSGDNENKKFRLLAFGTERVGLTPPSEQIEDRNFTLTFEKFSTQKRFHEFDGVLIFQGIFESFERKSNHLNSWLDHKCDRDELDKRMKELQLLLQNGGFVCFILTRPFIDREDRNSYTDSDLTKRELNYSSFYRENFNARVAHLETKRDEFIRFFDIYGAANTHFKNHNSNIDLRVVAEFRGCVVSMALFDNSFFIPCLLPDNNSERVEEFFRLLSDALASFSGPFGQDNNLLSLRW